MAEYIVRESGYPGTIKKEIVGEIVRCKDCVNCTHLVYEYDRCEEWWCGAKEVLPDGFCNDGKRRDDERYD